MSGEDGLYTGAAHGQKPVRGGLEEGFVVRPGGAHGMVHGDDPPGQWRLRPLRGEPVGLFSIWQMHWLRLAIRLIGGGVKE